MEWIQRHGHAACFCVHRFSVSERSPRVNTVWVRLVVDKQDNGCRGTERSLAHQRRLARQRRRFLVAIGNVTAARSAAPVSLTRTRCSDSHAMRRSSWLSPFMDLAESGPRYFAGCPGLSALGEPAARRCRHCLRTVQRVGLASRRPLQFCCSGGVDIYANGRHELECRPSAGRRRRRSGPGGRGTQATSGEERQLFKLDRFRRRGRAGRRSISTTKDDMGIPLPPRRTPLMRPSRCRTPL